MNKQRAAYIVKKNNRNTCEYWKAMDVLYETPKDSPLHHDTRHLREWTGFKCRPAKEIYSEDN